VLAKQDTWKAVINFLLFWWSFSGFYESHARQL